MRRHWASLLTTLVILSTGAANGQRINTVLLDGTQYFISALNPYSARYNFHLAYQYCRSVGLQLLSLETKEKTESLGAYLRQEGYGTNDFWTSGNTMGSNMWIWMSTGMAFNNSFSFWNTNTPQRERFNCLTLTNQRGPRWSAEDCNNEKEFICEQPRCFYFNYQVQPSSSGPSSSASSPLTSASGGSSGSQGQPPTRTPSASTVAKPTVIRRRITLRPTQLVLPTSSRNLPPLRTQHPAIPSLAQPSPSPTSSQNELVPPNATTTTPKPPSTGTEPETEEDSTSATTQSTAEEPSPSPDDLASAASSYSRRHVAVVPAPKAQGLLRPYGFERKEPVSWLNSRLRKG